MSNLLDNVWKYTADTHNPTISFGATEQNGRTTYFVKDNGAGFDMKHSAKLFTTFQRLHQASKFKGTGIGLATVSRIIMRHNGKLWAEDKTGRGANFYFQLGVKPSNNHY